MSKFLIPVLHIFKNLGYISQVKGAFLLEILPFLLLCYQKCFTQITGYEFR